MSVPAALYDGVDLLVRDASRVRSPLAARAKAAESTPNDIGSLGFTGIPPNADAASRYSVTARMPTIVSFPQQTRRRLFNSFDGSSVIAWTFACAVSPNIMGFPFTAYGLLSRDGT